MATSFRSKASAPTTLPSISNLNCQILVDESKTEPAYWTSPPEQRRPLVDSFRSDIKTHYFFGQSRRCCYCSFELQKNHATFDAEHILDRSTHPEFAFDTRNLAASCKPCNGSKSTKYPLSAPVIAGEAIPYETHLYTLVHPHLDEWDDHLQFDDLNRIEAKDGSTKGKTTIEACGIKALNCARLSDYFTGGQFGAEEALRGFFRVKQLARRRAYLALLRELAERFQLSQAKAIVDRLEKEELP